MTIRLVLVVLLAVASPFSVSLAAKYDGECPIVLPNVTYNFLRTVVGFWIGLGWIFGFGFSFF